MIVLFYIISHFFMSVNKKIPPTAQTMSGKFIYSVLSESDHLWEIAA